MADRLTEPALFRKILFTVALMMFVAGALHAQHFSFYRAGSNAQSISSVIEEYEKGKFRSIEGNFMNFGRTTSAYWIHFSIPAEETNKQWMLEIDNSHIYNIKVYRSERAGGSSLLYHAGINQAFYARPYPSRNFVFPISVKDGKQTNYFLWLDRRSEVLKFSIKLFERQDYLLYQNFTYWFYGCFAGVLIFIMIFNVFLRITLKDAVHTWYNLYIFFILLFVLADTGLGYEFLWGSFPGLNKHIRTFTGMTAFFLQLHFMQIFISQTASNSRVYRAVNWNKWSFLILSVLAALPLLFNFHFPDMVLGTFNNLFSLAYIGGIILVGLSLAERIYSKNKTGLIYLIAILPLIAQVLLVFFSRWHLISIPVDTSLTMAISILVEIIILTLGLTIRYNYFKIEKDKLEHALSRQRKDTVEKVLNAQEEERRRMAGDLHDDLGGTLSSIKGILSGIDHQTDVKTREILGNSQKLLDKACDDLRFIAHDLMPADFSNTQLHLAIDEVVKKLNTSSGIEFSYISTGTCLQLDKYLELNIYRILNELLHNIRKHSKASHAVVQLIYHEDFLQLMVEDNGRGFEVRNLTGAAGIGLKNIQSRIEYINGKIYFDSGKQGTTVTCNVPYPL